VSSSTAPDSALNCPLSVDGCDHGTHVAGTIAGRDYSPNGPGYNGVAPGAGIIAVQVFSQHTGADCTSVGLSSPCALSFTSDQILALERVYALRTSFNIAAANMSLGGGTFTSNCDVVESTMRKPIVDSLRAEGIDTTEKLLATVATDEGVAKVCKCVDLDENTVKNWGTMADLIRIKGLGGQWAELMWRAGVTSVQDLAQQEVAPLRAKFREVNEAEHRVAELPGENRVTKFIEQAKSLDPVLPNR